jgi:hypothetical protein
MIRYILDPARSAFVFAAALFFGYAIAPSIFYFQTKIDDGYLKLSVISVVAVVAILIGFLGRKNSSSDTARITISMEMFTVIVWVPFLITIIMIVATAPAIPLLTAIRGGSPDLIALQREEFLKSREGIEAIFVYLNALFTGALIPYSIALMFINKFKWRWFLTVLFLFYAISFVEKAFFLKIILPLLYLFGTGSVKSRFGPKTTLVVAAAILLLVTTLSGSGASVAVGGGSADFFSADYAPSSPLMHIIWRSFAVPVFTAADSLSAFEIYFHGHPFYGATSSFLAPLFGMERIPFERIVFEYQWGQNETGTGSSNSVYIIEAFVNFGWYGVIFFSLFVGRSLRWFANSKDEAFRAIWPLYIMGLYSAGLVGQLLSNGFIVILLLGFFINVRPHAHVGAVHGEVD